MAETTGQEPGAPPARLRVYLAGPLFTLGERRANRALALAIEKAWPGVHIVLPQDLKPHGKFNDPRTFGAIFEACLKEIDTCQAVLAVLDGPDADSGTCFEVGYAYAKGLPVVGVRTDFRESQERGLNIMLARACTALVHRLSFDEDCTALARDVARALRKVAARAEGGEK